MIKYSVLSLVLWITVLGARSLYTPEYLRSLKEKQVRMLVETAEEQGFGEDVKKQLQELGIFPDLFAEKRGPGAGAQPGAGVPGGGAAQGPGPGGAGAGAGQPEQGIPGGGGQLPGIPLPPPPPVGAPLVQPGEQPKPLPQQPQEEALPIQEALSQEVLPGDEGIVSVEEQQKSDAVLLSALRGCAYKAFATEKSTIGTGKYKKSFSTSLEAYSYYVPYILAIQLGKNPLFKKRQELKNFIYHKDGNALSDFMLMSLTKPAEKSLEEWLAELYQKNQDGNLLRSFKNLIAPCIFDQQLLNELDLILSLIIGNLVVLQRPQSVAPTQADKVLSDDVIMKELEILARDVDGDGKYQAFQAQYATYKKELDDYNEKRDQLRARQQLTPEETQELEELRLKGPPLAPVSGVLDKHYVHQLALRINACRLNSRFLRYRGLIGDLDAQQQGGVMGMGKEPFFNLLLGQLSLRSLQAKIMKDLLFDDGLIKPDSAAIKMLQAIEKDHNERVKPAVVAIDLLTEFKTRLSKVVTLGGMIAIFQQKRLIDSLSPEHKEIFKELVNKLKETDAGKPSPDKIVTMILGMLGSEDAQDELRSAIKPVLDKVFNDYALIKNLLAEVKSLKQQGGDTNTLLSQQIRGLAVQQKDLKTVQKKFYDLKRTPKSAYENLLGMVGSGELLNALLGIDKKEDFYTFVKPYGILIEVLEQYSKELGTLITAQDRVHLFIDTIKMLNNAELNRRRAHISTLDFNEVLVVRYQIYKGMLSDLINALEKYRLKEARAWLDQFMNAVQAVDSGGKLWTGLARYKTLVNTAFDALFLAMVNGLGAELQVLNEGKGSQEIQGVALDTADREINVRNALFYTQLKVILTTWIDAIGKGTLNVDEAKNKLRALDDQSLAALLQDFTIKLGEIRIEGQQVAEDLQRAARDYMTGMHAKIKNLRDYVPGVAAEEPGAGPGVPPPPPPPPPLPR